MKVFFKGLVLSSFFFYSSVFAQSSVEQKIENIMNNYNAVGLTVVTVKKNTPIYIHSFGLKNIEKQEKLTANDLFRIASISKSFTATAIMQLVEQKKIKLSDDISKHIGFTIKNPRFPEKIITVEMLLSHTSSLNDSEGYFNFDVINPQVGKNWKNCYNTYAPGAEYQYCNLNFNLLGAVIERITNTRFDQYIRKNILQPLQLEAGYNIDSLDNKKFVTLYNYENGYQASEAAYISRKKEIENYTLGYSTPIFSPTGGMKISAPDLAKYMTMHMNYGKYGKVRIISKKSSKRMQKPLSTPDNYGLALRRSNKLIPNVDMVGHTGSAYGLYSQMFFNPKKKYGFVVITNGCQNCINEPFNKLLFDVVQTLNDELIR